MVHKRFWLVFAPLGSLNRQNLESLRFIFGLQSFPPPHSQQCTFELVISKLEELNIRTKVKAVTTDGRSEMPSAMKHFRQTLNVDFSLRFNDICHASWIFTCLTGALLISLRLSSEKWQFHRTSLRVFITHLRSEMLSVRIAHCWKCAKLALTYLAWMWKNERPFLSELTIGVIPISYSKLCKIFLN